MHRPRSVICAVVILAACSFIAWSSARRIRRIDYVTALAGGSAPQAPSTATVERRLIVPNRNEPSYHWLAQTQQMLARRTARVWRVDYDNSPFGRDVITTSPYRWWLGTLAIADHSLTGDPENRAVEQAARWADPLLFAMFVGIGTLLIARWLGTIAAITFCIGGITLFPLGSEFLPGMPDAWGLEIICAIGSVTALVFGIEPIARAVSGSTSAASAPRKSRAAPAFAAAGVIGGLGVWISPTVQLPILFGTLLSGIAVTFVARVRVGNRPTGSDLSNASTDLSPLELPWRLWALWGGGTVLAAYLLEFAPGHLGEGRFDVIHPLYGLGWVAAGELLTRLTSPRAKPTPSHRGVDAGAILASAVVILGLAVALWRAGESGPFVRTPQTVQLARLPGSAAALNFTNWAAHGIGTLAFWAALAPLVIVFPAAWLACRRSCRVETRVQLALALGPVLVAVAFALTQLRWWAVADGMVLIVAALVLRATFTAAAAITRAIGAVVAVAIAVLDVVPLWPPKSHGQDTPISATDGQEIIERDLAHWLAVHAGETRPIIYAPPRETLTLGYYGPLRGIGTLAPENRAGLGAAVMIAGASTMESVQALLDSRQVRYLVIPSWDPFFENFSRLYLAKTLADRPSMLALELRRLNLPPWLKPVAYQMPPIGGFEKQWVLVFEVVDEQSPVVATSRMADFLVEMGDLDRAGLVAEALRKYPGNVGALAALAQVQLAEDDNTAARQTLTTLVSLVKAGGDRNLPWDRRVALAIALGRTDASALARTQTQRCYADVDDRKLRSLSMGALYNLLVLGHAFDLRFADPKLSDLALALLPNNLRSGL